MMFLVIGLEEILYMTTKEIIVIGSGGHARVVIDILQEMDNCRIIGITSTTLKQGDQFQGYAVLGDDSILPLYRQKNVNFVAMGVGGYRDNNTRTMLFENIKKLGFEFVNAIHPRSFVSKTSRIGEAVTIFPGVIINTDVTIGNNVIIATGATIDHESIIGDNVLISAGVTVGAYANVRNGSLLALGSKVISGIEIGLNSLVAAGAVVVSDVGDNKKVFGLPAKELS